jgi:hypothetical protein
MRGDAWTIFSREQMEREKMKDAALLVSRSLHETPLVTGGKLAGAAVLALGMLLATNARAQEPEAVASNAAFTTFSVTGAGTQTGQGTYALKIDDKGNILGVYTDAKNTAHGFLRNASGVITTLTAPKAGTGKYQGTVPVGIDTAGDIAGFYVDSKKVTHGFLRAAGSTTFTTFDAPPTNKMNALGTFPVGIDAAGDIAGIYKDDWATDHGFVRSAKGVITTFDVPGKITGTGSLFINATGEIVGVYRDDNSVYHGFVRTVAGKITTFSAPKAGTYSSQGTFPVGINASGAIAGVYQDGKNVYHGFLGTAAGALIPFDVPQASTGKSRGTVPVAIDASGNIAGVYSDANGIEHGFVRSSGGVITVFSVPGASTTAGVIKIPGYKYGTNDTVKLGGTAMIGMNAADSIFGIYADTSNIIHGFLRSSSGAFTTFDASEAGTGSMQGTVGLSINASGVVAGSYVDSNSALHGFVFSSSKLAATKTTLTAKSTTTIYGEPLTLTAKVSSTAGTPTAGDVVTFMNGTKALGTGKLSGGVATLTTTTIAAGTDSITAIYGGNASFAGSSSAAIGIKVTKATSTTKLAASAPTVVYGKSVTLTATVTGQYGGTATGTATFYHGTTKLGTASLSAGAAKLAVTTLPAGTDSVTASYSGDGNYAASTSTAISIVVNKVVAAPTFKPAGGSYTTAQTVTITDATPGATIYYTTNGSQPTTKSTKYTKPVSVAVTEPLIAIAVAPSYTNSYTSEAPFTIGGIKVTATLAASNYAPVSGQSLTLTATGTFSGTVAGTVPPSGWSFSIYDGATTLLSGVRPNTTTASGANGYTGSIPSLSVGTHTLWATYTAKIGGDIGISTPIYVTVKAK